MRPALAIPFSAVLALLACETPEVLTSPAPQPRPERAPPPEPPRRTAESLDLETYFARVGEGLATRGLLRVEGGGADAPWDTGDLRRAFLRIALFQEYTEIDGRLVLRETPNKLRRWTRPVLIEPRFDPLTPHDRRKDDRAFVAAYAERLARVTGHDIRMVDEGGNFPVLFLYDAERRRSGPALRGAIPGLGEAPVRAVAELTRATYCTLIVSDAGGDGRITNAVALIRAELPDDLRRACIHEEIAQGLGLTNDSAEVRPSIFADDDEWGRLTTLDEALLAVLYDPALTPGMGPEEVLEAFEDIELTRQQEPPS